MKLQHLSVIFIIIIMPIIIVFSEYMNTQLTIVKTEKIYDKRLFDSTLDAINAFQINTKNSTYYSPQSRVQNVEASVNTFYNSLVTSFEFEGNLATSMKAFIPAVVYTMYDGYYLYAPFVNKLTNVELEKEDRTPNVEEEYIKKDSNGKYIDGKIIEGLKPFVSYTCKYKYNDKEYIITYSMDNYIFVDVFDPGKPQEEQNISKGGYLINGIEKKNGGNTYSYNGIDFNKDDKEVLQEKIDPYDQDNNKVADTYYYTIVNGTKYYYGGNNFNGDWTQCSNDDYIFYIDEQRQKHKQIISKINEQDNFKEYYNKIFNNNYAYEYYKEAYEFTTWLLNSGVYIDIDGDGTLDEGQNLESLTVENIIGAKKEGNFIKKRNDQYQFEDYEFTDVNKIFGFNEDTHIEYSNSNFNRHRADVIRAVITTNLSKAITGYKKYSNADDVDFMMPKISEIDWELLENNICIASFLQGLKVGDKTYNSYCVIPNNSNKEYVDENDIYLLKTDNTYTRANDDTIMDGNLILEKNALGFEPGLYKMDFVIRQDKDGKYYNPAIFNNKMYLQSYTSFAGSSKINSIEKIDMYRYMNTKASDRLKKVYYTALARERYGSFKYTYDED